MTFRSHRAVAAGNVLTYMVVGAAAGVVATYVMGLVTQALYDREPADVREREDEVRGDKPAYERAADKGARLLGRFALGPRASVARALGFGTGFFLLFDEMLNWAMGLTPAPGAFPWQTHARGLTGHLVHGLTTHAVVRALDNRAKALGISPEA